MQVRTRFAPSPTGGLHIGGARTALYNFLHARREGGTFILRVEDTDQARSTDESLRTILDGLTWLGLTWDGEPVFQSRRLDLYRRAAERLEKSGRAYWREDEGKGRALVFRVDRERMEWEDLILGPTGRDTSEDPDLVIVKSDGFPTYNFACVVDDADLSVTHVLRGQEHVSNTPKQISLYRALGLEPPRFGHIPLIFDPSGAKISKRRRYDFPVTIEEVRAMGYLPAPFVNFLALLGWGPGGDRERMTLAEMIALFTLDRVNAAPARFLRDKLDWLNGLAIREMPLDDLVAACRPHLAGGSEETVRAAVAMQQARIKRLDEIGPLTEFVFADAVTPDDAARKVLGKEGARDALAAAAAALEPLDWSKPEDLEAALRRAAESRGVKFQHVAQPVRAALTGRTFSPPIQETLAVLGRERALRRIREAQALCPT